MYMNNNYLKMNILKAYEIIIQVLTDHLIIKSYVIINTYTNIIKYKHVQHVHFFIILNNRHLFIFITFILISTYFSDFINVKISN